MTTASTQPWWTSRRLEPDSHAYWEAGSLRLWALRTLHEWRIASQRQNETAAIRATGTSPPPDDAIWKRWAFSEEDAEISAVPGMPDRPLVVRPESPIRIPEGNEVRFFVSIPVWLRLFVGSRRRTFITEEPTLMLSKTWFGDVTAGELCYALHTTASRNLAGIQEGDHRCVCPLLIRNDSTHELDLQKVSLRTAHLNIFPGATRLWSEEVRVAFKGKDQLSEVSYGSTPPEIEKTGEKIGEAREVVPKSFIRRSFDTLWIG